MTRTREEVTELVMKVKDGDNIAFGELEKVAQPLLNSLSRKYARCHHKLEVEDLYATAQHALYKACISYNEKNPSFLDYAKIIIIRDFQRQMKYWNAKQRNTFDTIEVPIDSVLDMSSYDNIEEFDSEIMKTDFRDNVVVIIDECFDAKKREILRRYFVDNQRIVDIAKDMNVKYKNVYSVVNRGMKKIIIEYKRRHET